MTASTAAATGCRPEIVRRAALTCRRRRRRWRSRARNPCGLAGLPRAVGLAAVTAALAGREGIRLVLRAVVRIAAGPVLGVTEQVPVGPGPVSGR